MLGQSGHVNGTLPKEVLLLRKSLGKGISPDITGGMVATPTFNASHQTFWLHLCGVDPEQCCHGRNSQGVWEGV